MCDRNGQIVMFNSHSYTVKCDPESVPERWAPIAHPYVNGKITHISHSCHATVHPLNGLSACQVAANRINDFVNSVDKLDHWTIHPYDQVYRYSFGI